MKAIQIMRMFRTLISVSVPSSISLSASLGAGASLTFKSNGSMEMVDDGGTVTPAGQWLSSWPDSTNAALYEIQRTQVSGSLGVAFTGTLASGTWYPLNADRGVSVGASASLTRNNQSTWKIRRISDAVEVASFSSDLTSSP